MNREMLKAATAASAFAALVAAGLLLTTQRSRADSSDSEESKIQTGFAIAPVPLNLKGKNRSLVGLGSYIVNAQSGCNGCHSHGPQTEFVFGGNPYLGQHPTIENPAVYLGGGRVFGSLDPNGQSAQIISRNLTPDKSGLPEGGATFEEFVQMMRHGTDFDHWHPTCTGALGPHCVPPPLDGSLLQIMPWPNYAAMTDHDLRAIYEYLSAIPCLEGDPGNPDGADTHGQRCH